MPSVWTTKRPTKDGGTRHRVLYRVGWGESPRYGGSFKTKREAELRKAWIAGELAAMRVPDLSLLRTPERAPTLREAADSWRASRVDVTAPTRVLHRVSLDRVLPILGDKRVDEVTVEDVVAVVSDLVARGRKRETIKKSVTYLATVLDEQGLAENPARSNRVRLPHEDRHEPEPPTAEHVEAACRLLASAYRLPLLWLDWSGARLASVESLLVGDYDELGRRVRLRRSTQKTRQPLWVDLHPTLADAIEATLPPREDRDPEAPLFPGAQADRLRTALARACKAAGVPVFSPHALRHRRISLLHAQGRSWAEIGRLVGQRKISVTADTYTHVLTDAREAAYLDLVA